MASNNSTGAAIGIDLGTSYACVGYWKEGRAEIIANEEGDLTTPSYISYYESPSETLIGEGAKNLAPTNAANTVFDAKRLIGRKFSDRSVSKKAANWPFKLSEGAGGRPVVEVSIGTSRNLLTPEEITASLLRKLKAVAERAIGVPVSSAVISVPAFFNESQRQATKDAALLAGLRVLRVMNETSAAVLAWGAAAATAGERKVVVVDIGGGGVSATLFNVEEGIFEVKATAGDPDLGGEDFDTRMVKFVVQEVQRLHAVDLSADVTALMRIRGACERVKRTLSSEEQATLSLPALVAGADFELVITRTRFNELNLDLFHRALRPIDKVFQDSGVAKSEVASIVLVGGSSRIPMLRNMISTFFDGRELDTSMNADEAVAVGATMQAAVLSGTGKESFLANSLLLEVTPLSVGVRTVGDLFVPVISRNTTVPARKSINLSTFSHDQTEATIHVYEGESSLCRNNHLLGSFTVPNLPAGPRGSATIEVTFDIDVNEFLSVHAVDTSTGQTVTMQDITYSEILAARQHAELVSMANGGSGGALEHLRNGVILQDHTHLSPLQFQEMVAKFQIEIDVPNAQVVVRESLEDSISKIQATVEDLQSVVRLAHIWIDVDNDTGLSPVEMDRRHHELLVAASRISKHLAVFAAEKNAQ